MKIIVDAMGGDNAPLEIVRGALAAKAPRTISSGALSPPIASTMIFMLPAPPA